MATYILGTDAVAEEILCQLTKRAAAGVQVRLLIDDVGSQGVHGRHLASLVAAGGASRASCLFRLSRARATPTCGTTAR